jgi:hypothetical protein
MIHAFQPVVLELQVHAECLNSDYRLGVMSESVQSRWICHVRDKSVYPPIAGKVFERQFGRSGPTPEVKLAAFQLLHLPDQ